MESKQLRWIVRPALLYVLFYTCAAQFQQREHNPFFQERGSSRYNAPQKSQYILQPQVLRPKSLPTSGSSSSCPEPNGRFPVATQCDAYIECVDGVAEEKLCPEGLLFNPEARFNYPCGYPIDVQCLSRSSLQPPQPTEDCPHQYGYFKIGDRQNCGQFMNCVQGRSYVFNCPEGLAYNPESYRCDWPDQVADCDAEAYLGFTCPTINQSPFLNSEARFYKSPTDCQHYYVCVENRPRLHNCGQGHAFNELTGVCDAAENVTGCEPPSTIGVEPIQVQPIQQNLRSFNQQIVRSQQDFNSNQKNNRHSRQRFFSF